MRSIIRIASVFGVISLLAGVIASEEQCLVCHEGIEQISQQEDMAELSCTDCHMGDGEATDQNAAHQGMYSNPSDLRVVDEMCGDCHEEIIRNVKNSLHATMAGMISGTRYLWRVKNY